MDLSLEDLGNLAQCMAVFAGLVGLLYASGQVREMRHSTQSAAYLAFEEKVFDIGRLFIEHPQLRPYFYDGKELCDVTNDDLRIRVEGTALYLADFFDHALTIQKMCPDVAGWSCGMWKAWIDDMLATSPALRKLLEATIHEKWHAELSAMTQVSKENAWQRLMRAFGFGPIRTP